MARNIVYSIAGMSCLLVGWLLLSNVYASFSIWFLDQWIASGWYMKCLHWRMKFVHAE